MMEGKNNGGSPDLASTTENEKPQYTLVIRHTGGLDDAWQKSELADYLNDYGRNIIGMPKKQMEAVVDGLDATGEVLLSGLVEEKANRLISVIKTKFPEFYKNFIFELAQVAAVEK